MKENIERCYQRISTVSPQSHVIWTFSRSHNFEYNVQKEDTYRCYQSENNEPANENVFFWR